jgi:hypothetical protein
MQVTPYSTARLQNLKPAHLVEKLLYFYVIQSFGIAFVDKSTFLGSETH